MNSYKRLNALQQQVNNDVINIVNSMTVVKPSVLGLDDRCAYGRIYVDDDYVAVDNKHRGSLDHMGGFQYIEDHFIMTVGEFTFYSAGDHRVRNCINRFRNAEGEDDLEELDYEPLDINEEW